MRVFMSELTQRARRCPVACALKILLLLLFMSALNIAIFFKNAMSIYAFIGFMAVIGYVAIVAISTDINCRLKLSEKD
jgi:membrane protein YdbS with pleckstrin-like domain